MRHHNLTLIILFLFSSSLFSVPQEVWIKWSCHGVTTPKGVYPDTFEYIETYFLQIDVNKKIPSFFHLNRNEKTDPINISHDQFFTDVAKHCTQRRRAMTDISGVPSDTFWLNWGTENEYSRFSVDIFKIEENHGCRQLEEPCTKTSQCCNSNQVTCNQTTNSCKSLVATPNTPKQL